MNQPSSNASVGSARALLLCGVAGATAIAICALIFWLSTFDFSKNLELQGYDLLVSRASSLPPSAQILVVDFDDDSVKQLNAFPLPRRLLADVVDRIAAGKPSVIGLDVILDRRRSDGDDQVLADAVDRAGNVILVSEYGFGDLGRNEPLPEFESKATGVGFGDLPQDEDGVVRRFLILLNQPDYKRLSFPVALSLYATEQKLRPGGRDYVLLGSTAIPLMTHNPDSALIGFRHATSSQAIPVTELLRSTFDAGIFKDKIVLIGQSSEMGRDLFTTPVFRFRAPTRGRSLLSGAEIHAATIASLLDGRFPREASPVLQWSVNAIFAFSLFLITARTRWPLAVAVSLIAVIGTVVLASLLFSQKQLWMPYLATEACILLTAPAAFGFRYVEERSAKRQLESERRQLMGLFERYVSPDVAAEIWKHRDQVVLAGEERVATVLFSDIRSFTALTTGKPSAQVLQWLNRYLTAMSGVVKAHRGFLNKFVGDGIMVVFGAPLSEGGKEDAYRAIQCALQMMEEVEKLNARRNADEPQLKIGIGIHTGSLTAGNVGSTERLEYSVIGETVNLASRLEGLTKTYQTEIIISSSTWELVHDSFATQPLGETEVRGFSGKISLYGVTAGKARGVSS